MSHPTSEPPQEDRIGLADIFFEACQAGLEDELAVCYRTLADERLNPETVIVPAATAVEAWYQETLRREVEEQLVDRGLNTLIRLEYRAMWLWRLEEMPRFRIEPLLRQHELVRTHRLAIDAMRFVYGGETKPAKAMQNHVSEGVPLAICIGEHLLQPIVDGRVENFAPPGMRSGCGAIFEDNRSGHRKPFPVYCRDCRGLRRHPLREAEQAVRRRRKSVR